MVGVNLTKNCERPVHKNYKTMLWEVKENLNKWRDRSCSLIRRLNVVVTSPQIDL